MENDNTARNKVLQDFLSDESLSGMELSIKNRILNGLKLKDEATAQLENLDKDRRKAESILVSLTHQIFALTDLVVELKAKAGTAEEQPVTDGATE